MGGREVRDSRIRKALSWEGGGVVLVRCLRPGAGSCWHCSVAGRDGVCCR